MYNRKGTNGLIEKREKDMQNEEEFITFLEKVFYDNIPGVSCEHKRDAANQFTGVDALVFYEGKKYCLDEKCQASNYGCPTQTFCFELESDNMTTHERIPGWFIKKDSKTDYFFLMYVTEVRPGINKKDIKPKDFLRIEAYLVKKSDALKFVEAHDFTDEKLAESAKKIYSEVMKRKKEGTLEKGVIRFKEGWADSFKTKNGKFLAYFTSSENTLAERPINLIIQKYVFANFRNTIKFDINIKEGYIETSNNKSPVIKTFLMKTVA